MPEPEWTMEAAFAYQEGFRAGVEASAKSEQKHWDDQGWEHENPSLEAQVKRLRKEMDLIAGMCGNPDAAEACRLIIRKVKEIKEFPQEPTALAPQENL